MSRYADAERVLLRNVEVASGFGPPHVVVASMTELIDHRTRVWAAVAVVIGVVALLAIEYREEPDMRAIHERADHPRPGTIALCEGGPQRPRRIVGVFP